MRRAAALSLPLFVALARLAAAAQPAPPAGVPTGAVATGVQGALVLEPGRIRAGDLADLEIVVATPPDHALRPVAPPASLPGFWLLGAEALPVEKADGRWTYGRSMIVDAWGTVLSTCPDRDGCALADLDLEYLARLRTEFPSLANPRTQSYSLTAE